MNYLVQFYPSSLGTNYARADFSNVVTKSLGQNGYYKFPDGFMLQWGYTSAANSYQTVYFPVAFYDTNYTVVTTAISTYMDSIVKMVANKYTSSFRVYSVGSNMEAGEPWNWFAIGRWK